MIDCKQCPDKMKCVTGDIKDCRRGFKLKKCCREYLTNRRKHLLRTILTAPEEMIKDGKFELNEVCRTCGKKIQISIQVGESYKMWDEAKLKEWKKILEKPIPMPVHPNPYGPWKDDDVDDYKDNAVYSKKLDKQEQLQDLKKEVKGKLWAAACHTGKT